MNAQVFERVRILGLATLVSSLWAFSGVADASPNLAGPTWQAKELTMTGKNAVGQSNVEMFELMNKLPAEDRCRKNLYFLANGDQDKFKVTVEKCVQSENELVAARSRKPSHWDLQSMHCDIPPMSTHDSFKNKEGESLRKATCHSNLQKARSMHANGNSKNSPRLS